MSENTAKAVIHGGFFMALTILFTFVLAVKTPFIRIDFAFIPLALYAAIWGPWRAGLMFALVDILGTNLFLPGTYFFGYTITNFITGFIYGKFLYRREFTLKRTLVMSAVVFLAVTCALNNIWLALQFGDAAAAFFITRAVKGAVFIFIKTAVLVNIYKLLRPLIAKNYGSLT